MQDYNYIHSDCFEITIEMGCCKFPPARELEGFWLDNQKSLLEYIERVSYEAGAAVRGRRRRRRIKAGGGGLGGWALDAIQLPTARLILIRP